MNLPHLDLSILSSARLRIGILLFLIFCGYSVLVVRLWKMQVLEREEYREKSMRQSVRTIRIPPVRGRILSRDGSPLADNRVSWNVILHLAELRERTAKRTRERTLKAIEKVARRIGRRNYLTETDIQRHMNYYPGIPMLLFADLTADELGRIHEQMPFIPGLEVTAEPVRAYPNGPLAAQIIGYTGPADLSRVEDRKNYFYYIADLAGKAGLEYMFDEKLRGKAGSRLAVVTSAGFVHEYVEEESTAEHNGFDLELTIDVKAQRIAESLLENQAGAIVLLNAENGEVLAMASAPTYDPGLFVPRISYRDYANLISDPLHPFLNRAAQGSYMPGSIIKPLTALAGLRAGVDPDKIFECTGKVPYGYSSIRCMGNAVHGELTMQNALKRSCNGYFVSLGMQIGIRALSEEFESAGIGSPTGFLMREADGHLPRPLPSWKEQETAYVAFGQGQVEVTPLQAAVYTAAIANGGTRWKPLLLKHISDTSDPAKTVSIFDAEPEITGRLEATPEALDVVRDGMHRVVWEQGGSGSGARCDKIELSGKTGTADVVTRGGQKYKNTWFIGFGRSPETKVLYAIAVLVEHGVSGGKTAAPIAGKFFRQYLP